MCGTEIFLFWFFPNVPPKRAVLSVVLWYLNILTAGESDIRVFSWVVTTSCSSSLTSTYDRWNIFFRVLNPWFASDSSYAGDNDTWIFQHLVSWLIRAFLILRAVLIILMLDYYASLTLLHHCSFSDMNYVICLADPSDRRDLSDSGRKTL